MVCHSIFSGMSVSTLTHNFPIIELGKLQKMTYFFCFKQQTLVLLAFLQQKVALQTKFKKMELHPISCMCGSTLTHNFLVGQGKLSRMTYLFCHGPPSLSDLNTCEFFFWGYVIHLLFLSPLFRDLAGLRERVTRTVNAVISTMLCSLTGTGISH